MSTIVIVATQYIDSMTKGEVVEDIMTQLKDHFNLRVFFKEGEDTTDGTVVALMSDGDEEDIQNSLKKALADYFDMDDDLEEDEDIAHGFEEVLRTTIE